MRCQSVWKIPRETEALDRHYQAPDCLVILVTDSNSLTRDREPPAKKHWVGSNATLKLQVTLDLGREHANAEHMVRPGAFGAESDALSERYAATDIFRLLLLDISVQLARDRGIGSTPLSRT
jgi:hypothetical protein